MEAHREKAEGITPQADTPAPAAAAAAAEGITSQADTPAPAAAAAEGITSQADTQAPSAPPPYPSIPAVSTDHPVEAVAASVDTATPPQKLPQPPPPTTPADPSIPAVSTDHPVEAVAASVDTAKSQIHPTFTTSKQLKEEEKKKKEEEAKQEKKENGVQKLKSSLLVTGVMVAVIGAIFAVVKNIKKS